MNTSDTDYRSIDNGWTSMAFALDFGSTTGISNLPNPPVFALGLVRDPVMQYDKDGTQRMSSLWWLRWNNVGQAVLIFITSHLEVSFLMDPKD